MLSGNALALAFAGALIAAVALGAGLHALWQRSGRRREDGAAADAERRIAELSAELEEAEVNRQAAELAVAEAEADIDALRQALARAEGRSSDEDGAGGAG